MMSKLATILRFVLLLLCLNSSGLMKVANGEVGQGRSWCIAKSSSTEAEQTANVNFACDHLLSCEKIQPDGSCYYPNTTIIHASVAMNLYYHQYTGKHSWNCDFGNSGLITISDPSYDNCTYAS